MASQKAITNFLAKGYQTLGIQTNGCLVQGYPDRGYLDQGYPDRGYPDRGYPDRGYPDQTHKIHISYTRFHVMGQFFSIISRQNDYLEKTQRPFLSAIALGDP